MPTYEYQCLKCNYKFDWLQDMTEKHLEHCPKCGGKLERMIGPGAGIIFKGSGFYATDYAKKPAKTVSNHSAKTNPCNNKEGLLQGGKNSVIRASLVEGASEARPHKPKSSSKKPSNEK